VIQKIDDEVVEAPGLADDFCHRLLPIPELKL